jgi:hypothetical protein
MSDDGFFQRFETEASLGPLVMLRQRAETLRRMADLGLFTISKDEREELNRIAATCKEDDRGFLRGFEERFMQAAERLGRAGNGPT